MAQVPDAGPAPALHPGTDPVAYADTLARARADAAARRWAGAARGFAWAAAQHPDDGRTWRALAIARTALEDWPGAAGAAAHAYALGTRRQPDVALLAAAAQARLFARRRRADDADSALAWLTRALVDERLEFRAEAAGDPAYAALLADPRAGQRARALLLAPPAAADRVAGWRGDVDWLAAEVARLNAPAREPALPPAFVRAAAQLKADVPRLGDAAVTVRLMALLASLGRGHNGLWPWTPPRHGALNQAPITLYAFAPRGGAGADGAYDLRVAAAALPWRALVGRPVRRVGTASPAEALAAVAALVERENEADLLWRGPELLTSPAVLHALGVSPSADTLRLVLGPAALGGRDTTVLLPAKPFRRRAPLAPYAVAAAAGRPVPLADRQPERAYWTAWLADTVVHGVAVRAPVLYLAFNQVADDPGEALPAFGLRLRRELAARAAAGRPATAVVVDLRRNNGGDTYRYRELLRTLVWYGAQPGGRLYALVGRNTYSAAENFLVDLERLTDLTVAGEPTGGKPATHGDESPVVLPYSGLAGGLSAVYWALGGPRDARRWVAPDLPAPLTAAAWARGDDPALAAALRHLARAAAPPATTTPEPAPAR